MNHPLEGSWDTLRILKNVLEYSIEDKRLHRVVGGSKRFIMVQNFLGRFFFNDSQRVKKLYMRIEASGFLKIFLKRIFDITHV